MAKRDYYLRHVRLSVRMEQLRSYWTDFHKILFECFSKIFEKIQGPLKSDKNNGYPA
jgi:hypothetical protein